MSLPELGIFARVFPAGSAFEVGRAVADAGYSLVQLNLRAIGLPTVPRLSEWATIDTTATKDAFGASGVRCWGLSCSYNMAHPDPLARRSGTEAALELMRRAPGFGVTAVTLCTGSRNADRMWAYHPDNGSAAAWRDMRTELDLLLPAAAEAGTLLAIEPEPGTIVSDANAALRLYSELGNDAARVGIIADSANLVTGRPPAAHREVLEHAFSSLADRIICLHAKDLVPWAETLAGRGAVDYELVAALHARLELAAPVIVQDVAASQAGDALRFLKARFAA